MSVIYGYPTQEEIASWPAKEAEQRKIETISQKKIEISNLELKNLRKLYDGEDMTAVNAERLKLRNEIKQLEGK